MKNSCIRPDQAYGTIVCVNPGTGCADGQSVPPTLAMHHSRLLALVVISLAGFAAAAMGSPAIGSTLDAVLNEKGQPTGRSGAGTTAILTYPDETIILKNGHVTEVRSNGEVTTVPERKLTDAERRRVVAENAAASARSAADAHVATTSWTTDYDSALSTAGSNGRKVFLFFTGSDWCGWCMKLQREILTTPEFTAYATDNLILVELDFPRSKSIEAGLRANNERLAQKYGIRGFPTVVVLDAHGKVLGKLGYQAGGPAPFVEQLRKL